MDKERREGRISAGDERGRVVRLGGVKRRRKALRWALVPGSVHTAGTWVAPKPGAVTSSRETGAEG